MKYQSPQPVRFSILTNLREQKPPSINYGWSSILAKIFIAICILVIVYALFQPNNQVEEQEEEYQEQYEENSMGIVSIYSLQDIRQIDDTHPISIPLINVKKESQKDKNIRQQLEESLENIKIFQLLHSHTKPLYDILEKYFIKIQPLFVIKHQKFTSPSRNSKLQITNLNWWNPFYNSQAKQYNGVDKIFQIYNDQPWISDGKYLTIVSHQPFKPTFIVIYCQNEKDQYKNRVYLYGLSAFDSALTNKNTLQQTYIKKVDLKRGRNEIQCDKPQCSTQYSMLMLVFDEVHVLSLEVYSRKKYIAVGK